MRQENCSYQTASDGATRCLPSANANASNGYFSDAGCTVKLGLVAGCADQTPYAQVTSISPTCGSIVVKLYAKGAQYGGQVYSGNTTSCSVISLGPSFTFFQLGAEIPPDSFVQATEQIAP